MVKPIRLDAASPAALSQHPTHASHRIAHSSSSSLVPHRYNETGMPHSNQHQHHPNDREDALEAYHHHHSHYSHYPQQHPRQSSSNNMNRQSHHSNHNHGLSLHNFHSNRGPTTSHHPPRYNNNSNPSMGHHNPAPHPSHYNNHGGRPSNHHPSHHPTTHHHHHHAPPPQFHNHRPPSRGPPHPSFSQRSHSRLVSQQPRHPIHELTQQLDEEHEEEEPFVAPQTTNRGTLNVHPSPCHKANTSNQPRPLPLQPRHANNVGPLDNPNPAAEEEAGQELQPLKGNPELTNNGKEIAPVEKDIAPVVGQENVQQNAPSHTAIVSKATNKVLSYPASSQTSAPRGSAPLAMKSPVTMVFDRMLGAAEYLAHNPTPEVVKKNLLKRKKEHEEPTTTSSLNIMAAAAQQQQQAPPNANVPANNAVDGVDPQQQRQGDAPIAKKEDATVGGAVAPTNKRTKTSRTAHKNSVPLEPGNPFLELEQDEELLQKVILQMALISESKETKRSNHANQSSTEPAASVPSTISEGFYWRDYPVLEDLLFDNMKQYYNMSSQNRQSRHQQDFNNGLVARIRLEASKFGFQFDPSFNDKRLRDRIRCFYKTHLQNAKKRLATLQKHPQSPIHQSHLRIYIRCVRNSLTLEESEAREAKERGTNLLAGPSEGAARPSSHEPLEEPARESV